MCKQFRHNHIRLLQKWRITLSAVVSYAQQLNIHGSSLRHRQAYATSNKSHCRMDWRVPSSYFSVYANSLLVTYVYHLLPIPHFQMSEYVWTFLVNIRLNTRENIGRSTSRRWQELSKRVHGQESNTRRGASGSEQTEVGVPMILLGYHPHCWYL